MVLTKIDVEIRYSALVLTKIEGDNHGDGEHDRESEDEREQSLQEVEVVEREEESEGRDSDSDAKDGGYSQHGVTSKRRDDVVESGSERSEENQYAHHDDGEEVDEARSPRYLNDNSHMVLMFLLFSC